MSSAAVVATISTPLAIDRARTAHIAGYALAADCASDLSWLSA
jgi:hypothetical protein